MDKRQARKVALDFCYNTLWSNYKASDLLERIGRDYGMKSDADFQKALSAVEAIMSKMEKDLNRLNGEFKDEH